MLFSCLKNSHTRYRFPSMGCKCSACTPLKECAIGSGSGSVRFGGTVDCRLGDTCIRQGTVAS